MARDLTGQVFNRWTVLSNCLINANGERKWLCRCQCGTGRYVLERSLLSGGSQSCGCLRKENVWKEISPDLTSRVFGELTVQCQADKRHGDSRVWWRCLCSCGINCEVPGTLLMIGRRTNCGNTAAHPKHYAYKDIAGKKYNHLLALYPLKQRSKCGNIQWHCRCDCGNEVDISYNELVYSNMKSCGCIRREHEQNLSHYLTHVDGTSLDMIKSRKIPSNNSTGIKGVYLIRGKYVAKIVFQKKTYYLGTFNNLEEAARVRTEAEKLLYDGTASFYDKWKQRADADPAWAADNPVKIYVTKDSEKGLQVQYLPEL